MTKSLVRNKGELPKYYAENTHPPIVDTEVFEKAQEIMARNREKCAGKKANKKYPFTSKIKCGNCGKNYKRKASHGRVYWACSTYLKFGKDSCSSKMIQEDILFSLAADVLGLDEFDEAMFQEKIKEIQVPDFNMLVFIFNDGEIVQKEWNNKSRS